MCKVLPLSMVDTARAPTRSNAQHSGSHVHWCLPLLQQPRVLQANVPFSASGVLLLIMVDNSVPALNHLTPLLAASMLPRTFFLC